MKTINLFWLVLSLILIPSLTTRADEKPDPYNAYRWQEGDNGNWFEWWYYKVVDPTSNQSFFFSYGIVNPGDKENAKPGTKSAIQAGSYSQKITAEKDFSIDDFEARRDRTEVHLGSNSATDKNITGSILDPQGQAFSWNLDLKKNWAFNAMGIGMYIPEISDIYWYPAQASATMSGTVHFQGKDYVLKDAPAYQDRNWGRGFPEWWTWLVSNNFKNSPGTTLAAGGGHPRVLSVATFFTGLCIGLQYQGHDYVFRTTDGNDVKFDIQWGKWEVSATNFSGEKIEISAYAPPGKFMLLPFTTPQGEKFYDYETLTGSMEVRLSKFEAGQWKPITTLETDEAGIEWGSPHPVSFETLFQVRTSLQ